MKHTKIKANQRLLNLALAKTCEFVTELIDGPNVSFFFGLKHFTQSCALMRRHFNFSSIERRIEMFYQLANVAFYLVFLGEGGQYCVSFHCHKSSSHDFITVTSNQLKSKKKESKNHNMAKFTFYKQSTTTKYHCACNWRRFKMRFHLNALFKNVSFTRNSIHQYCGMFFFPFSGIQTNSSRTINC